MVDAPYSEPDTSKAAAASLNKFKREIDKERILQFIQAQGSEGATDQEIEIFTKIKGDTLRPRRGELMKAGKITKAPFKRETKSGRQAAVWIASREPNQ